MTTAAASSAPSTPLITPSVKNVTRVVAIALAKNVRNSTPMMGGTAGFGYVTMGGMFTLLKVRDALPSYADPGWYQHPPGTTADIATPDELQRDGIGG